MMLGKYKLVNFVVFFVTNAFTCSLSFAQEQSVNTFMDFDGDGKTAHAVYRASNNSFIYRETLNNQIVRMPLTIDGPQIPLNGNFSGTTRSDAIFVHRDTGTINYLEDGSRTLLKYPYSFDPLTETPLLADIDGDTVSELVIFTQGSSLLKVWNDKLEVYNTDLFFSEFDIPVAGDFDGDGRDEVGIRRPVNRFWYMYNFATSSSRSTYFGSLFSDIPIPADYDGDGKDDFAVRRRANGYFIVRESSTGRIIRYRFGFESNDLPIVGDYDGDGKADIAVRRARSAQHIYLRSSDRRIVRTSFGLLRDDLHPLVPHYSYIRTLGLPHRPLTEVGDYVERGVDFSNISEVVHEYFCNETEGNCQQ